MNHIYWKFDVLNWKWIHCDKREVHSPEQNVVYLMYELRDTDMWWILKRNSIKIDFHNDRLLEFIDFLEVQRGEPVEDIINMFFL